MSYRETNDTPESFYVDSFRAGEQLEITRVLRAIAGAVDYDQEARHLGEPRARYRVTLPAGCVHSGSDAALAPQTVTLPGGRSLCVYPGDESVMLGWLPGDSADSALWVNDTRVTPGLSQFYIYRSELPNLAETDIIIAAYDVTPREDWGVPVDAVEARTHRDALQIYLNRAGLEMPFGGMRSTENASYITFKKQAGR